MSKGQKRNFPVLEDADMSLGLRRGSYMQKLAALQQELARIQQAYLFPDGPESSFSRAGTPPDLDGAVIAEAKEHFELKPSLIESLAGRTE